MAWRQLFGEGKHGEDDQEHGYGAQEKATPPERLLKAGETTPHKTSRALSSNTDTHAYSPVANEARVTLVYVDYSFGVDIEADENASKEVASRRSQGSHYIHDGWKKKTKPIGNFH